MFDEGAAVLNEGASQLCFTLELLNCGAALAVFHY